MCFVSYREEGLRETEEREPEVNLWIEAGRDRPKFSSLLCPFFPGQPWTVPQP